MRPIFKGIKDATKMSTDHVIDSGSWVTGDGGDGGSNG